MGPPPLPPVSLVPEARRSDDERRAGQSAEVGQGREGEEMCNDGWESEGAGVTAAAGMAERPLESAAAGMSERPLEMAAGGPELLGKQAGLDATTVEDQLRVGNKKEKGDEKQDDVQLQLEGKELENGWVFVAPDENDQRVRKRADDKPTCDVDELETRRMAEWHGRSMPAGLDNGGMEDDRQTKTWDAIRTIWTPETKTEIGNDDVGAGSETGFSTGTGKGTGKDLFTGLGTDAGTDIDTGIATETMTDKATNQILEEAPIGTTTTHINDNELIDMTTGLPADKGGERPPAAWTTVEIGPTALGSTAAVTEEPPGADMIMGKTAATLWRLDKSGGLGTTGRDLRDTWRTVERERPEEDYADQGDLTGARRTEQGPQNMLQVITAALGNSFFFGGQNFR